MSDRLIWDLPVRVIHWTLFVAILGSWYTQEAEGDLFRYHLWCGYTVLVLVLVRIAWGFVGTRHARFASFLRGPRAAVVYARELLSGRASGYPGHNPLGAWMVVLLLTLLLTQACTGLFANDQIMNTGPLFGFVSVALSDRLTSIHKTNFDWILVAGGVHIAAAFGYLLVKRENLITPMITGRKAEYAASAADAVSASRSWLAVLILLAVATGLAWIVRRAPEATLSIF